MHQNLSFDVAVRFVRTQDAEAALNKQQLDMFVVIPPDFVDNMKNAATRVACKWSSMLLTPA